VRASLVEWENRLKINYLITDAETGERMTRASTVQVAVEIDSREMQLASPQVMLDAVARCCHECFRACACCGSGLVAKSRSGPRQ
jgi:acyl-CoA thioesterase FadM